MAARTANALWEGTLNEGSGRMSVGSGAFEGQFSAQSRFGEGDNGTNPEELLAAAYAGCFSMALALLLEEGGNAPDSIQTTAKVSMRNVEGSGPTITKIALTTRGRVPGLDQDAFEKAAENTKETCIVSRALGGIDEKTVEATLES